MCRLARVQCDDSSSAWSVVVISGVAVFRRFPFDEAGYWSPLFRVVIFALGFELLDAIVDKGYDASLVLCCRLKGSNWIDANV